MKIEIDYTPPSTNINHHFAFGEDLAKMLAAGIEFAKDGSRAEARHLLSRVAEVEPDNENAWLWLASISEYPEELLVFLQNVLRINPENERAIEWMRATKSMLSDTFVQRGTDASQENRQQYAVQCFMQALLHDNRNESAWLWLASNSDSPEEKRAHLQKVLDINPENETALASLHSLKYQLTQQLLKRANFAAISGEREEARQFLEEAMQDAPELEEAWILKAYLADAPEEKIACYQRILDLNPENEAAHAGLASLNSLMQKNSEQKSNAERLRDVLEANGAEILNAEVLSDCCQEVSDSGVESALESLDADEQPIEDQDNSSKTLISENYQFGGKFESTENPTDELQASFVEEVKSQGGFSEEFLSESSAPEEFSEQSESINVNNENLVAIAFEQTDEAPANDDLDDIMQFVEKAEAQLFQGEENEVVLFESIEESQEEDELNEIDDFSYQTAGETFDKTFEILPETHSNDQLPHIEEFTLQNNENSFSVQTNSMETAPNEPVNQTIDFDQPENTPAAEERHVELLDEEQEISPVGAAPDEETIVHKSLSQAEPLSCSFCYAMNEPHAVVCGSCRMMFSLSDLETLLSYTEADPQVVEMAIEDLENEKNSRDLNAAEFTNLGIAYLHHKNLRKALGFLQEAAQLAPNDVVLGSKVNFLAIRVSEIEAQESKMEGAVVKNLTVLIVDDSPTVRKLISGKLEKCGHTVVTAADGAEAMGKIKEVVPDLILLDIMMPQMDGYQVCKLIRSNEPTKDVPVVMISGKDGFFDKVRGRMAGTTGYITKPFGPETLMRTIETYVS